MMESVLERILTVKRQVVERTYQEMPLPELIHQARDTEPPRNFKAALMAKGLSVIAEVKRASPSRGQIANGIDVNQLAQQYQEGGAVAISVLTEEDFFLGSLDDLRQVKKTVSLPVLRKDFIFDPYQIWESRVVGADAILLIASMFEVAPLRQLIGLARQLQLTSLVEIHNGAELGMALNAGADVIGVNARDLGNFAVDLGAPLSLAPLVPPGIVKVAESGIKTRDDVLMLVGAGYESILVGETLMRAEDPVQTLRALIG